MIELANFSEDVKIPKVKWVYFTGEIGTGINTLALLYKLNPYIVISGLKQNNTDKSN